MPKQLFPVPSAGLNIPLLYLASYFFLTRTPSKSMKKQTVMEPFRFSFIFQQRYPVKVKQHLC